MNLSDRVTLKEILSPTCSPERRFVSDLEHLKVLAEQIRTSGYTVGIVGGVWDLPHIGHARYLALAKQECDVLVVVVDSDELVRDRKGPTRPIVPEEERVQMVCHLSSADIVTTRSLKEHLENKEYLNIALRPDVCVLSTSTGDIPESQRAVIAQFVKRIKVFEPQAETSTSARIRLLAIDSAQPLAVAVQDLVNARIKEVTEGLASLGNDIEVLTANHVSKLGNI